MRWRAASTSARSGTGDAVMARVYHGPSDAMSRPAIGRTVPALRADHGISGDHEQSPVPRLAQAHTAAVISSPMVTVRDYRSRLDCHRSVDPHHTDPGWSGLAIACSGNRWPAGGAGRPGMVLSDG